MKAHDASEGEERSRSADCVVARAGDDVNVDVR
jgi:hypothetical protein